jgi:hypothetical protein
LRGQAVFKIEGEMIEEESEVNEKARGIPRKYTQRK